MVAAYKSIHDLSRGHKISMREAAYRLAIDKVAKAMVRRGAQ